MLHRLMSLFASLFGRFSTTCVKQRSAGKRTCRTAFALLLIPLFALPTFAFETEIDFGFLQGYGYWQANDSNLTYEPWLSDFTAHHVMDVYEGETYNFYNDTPFERAVKGTYIYDLGNSVEIEFFITGTDVQFSNAQFRAPCMVSFKNIDDIEANIANGSAFWRTPSLTWQFYVDGVLTDEYESVDAYLPAGTFTYDGAVDSTIILKAIVNEQAELSGALDTVYPYLYGFVQLSLQAYYIGDKTEYSEDFKLIFNKLDSINDNIQISNEYLVSIDNGVVSIQQDVSDVKQQLEMPSSSIWQAAGQTIKDAVTDMFVPTQEQITDVKQQFDELAQDKLGGAYTAMDTVDQTINDLNDKLSAPSAQQGIEFPGISVPLGGDVGTVEIISPQTVTLPTQLMSVFHPIAGIIIPIIVGLGTFNTLKDLVACFLSGYSYSEYLHRNKGGGD